MQQQLSEASMKVLRLLQTVAMDGYTIMSKSRLGKEDLAKALSELTQDELVEVKGEPEGPAVGEAYVWVPPDARGRVDYILRGSSLR